MAATLPEQTTTVLLQVADQRAPHLIYFLTIAPVTAEVVSRHIEYVSPHFYVAPVIVLYLAATCISCFFSSHRFVILFGVLALLSFIAAYLYQVHALVSIWCFFAAILSLLVYLHLRFRDLGGFPRDPPFAPVVARSAVSGQE